MPKLDYVGSSDPGVPDSAKGVPLADSGKRERYADAAASPEKLPFSDVPVNAPPNFQDFLGKIAAVNPQAPYVPPPDQALLEQRRQIREEVRIERQIQESGAPIDTTAELPDFARAEAERVMASNATDGALYQPPRLSANSNLPPSMGGDPINFVNHGGSPKSHRTQYSPAPNTTAGAGNVRDVVPNHVKDEILINLVAGRSAPYIQRLLRAKYNFSISSDTIYLYKRTEPWRSVIEEGRRIRYDSIRTEGMALIDERVILLQHNAEQLQLRIDEIMSQGGVPPLGLMKEFRETLDDIALELGQRSRNQGNDNGLKVAVVRGPQKALTSESWAAEAQEASSAEEASFKELEGEYSEGSPQGSSDLTPRPN